MLHGTVAKLHKMTSLDMDGFDIDCQLHSKAVIGGVGSVMYLELLSAVVECRENSFAV